GGPNADPWRCPRAVENDRCVLTFSGGALQQVVPRWAMKPSYEWVLQHAGSLPEEVAEDDLGTLNAGLRFLFDDLRSAQRLYQEQGDSGRAGASAALGAVCRYLMLFKGPLAETLHVPILNLHDLLQALENGFVGPMLKPVPHCGRPPSTDAREALKGCVAGTV